MDKMKMAHDYAMQLVDSSDYTDDMSIVEFVAYVWQYADAMQAEADKRNKAEAAQKHKKMREMLNAPNTFVEREGQHFDDVEEWQPDWSQAPEWAKWWYKTSDNKFQWCSKKPYQDGCNWFVNCSVIYTLDIAPSFSYTGKWQDSLRERPE